MPSHNAKDPPETDLRDLPPHAPELRWDPLSSTAVFLAPQRGLRPIELGEAAATSPTSPHQTRCPFCRGHERLAPPSVLSLPDEASWRARVVPNRYPIVEAPPTPPTLAPHDQPSVAHTAPRPAVGLHEVLIESPDHHTRVESIPAATWATAWQASRQRLESFAAHPRLRFGMLFKNAGPQAGASLAHVHSQLVGLDFLPTVIEHKLSRLREDLTLHERVLDDARREQRIWGEAGGLVAFVPAAPRQPFESCIMSEAGEPFFHMASSESVAAIASLTQRYAEQLSGLTPTADYNWWLHQAPFAAEIPAGWHWHLEIMPRLTQLAGFELATGCHITTMPPTIAARLLREGNATGLGD
jgi:UDPglucose--hexose-1-phosphate uridylyltransferase